MISYFAHEVSSGHIHTNDGGSPAIYIGIIGVTLGLVIVAGLATYFLQRKSAEEKSEDEV